MKKPKAMKLRTKTVLPWIVKFSESFMSRTAEKSPNHVIINTVYTKNKMILFIR